MSSKINLQTCEYARKSSIFQDNQLILRKNVYYYNREFINRGAEKDEKFNNIHLGFSFMGLRISDIE